MINKIIAYDSVYLAIVGEEFDMYRAMVLTESEKGKISKETPVINLKNKTIIALPFWIYIDKKTAKSCKQVGEIEDTKRLIEYALKAEIPNNQKGRYIRNIMRKLATINTRTIFKSLDNVEK